LCGIGYGDRIFGVGWIRSHIGGTRTLPFWFSTIPVEKENQILAVGCILFFS
jgi:hypothetical protein